MRRRSAGLPALLALVSALGCDPATKPWKEALSLEASGQEVEAADRFDAVCATNTQSKHCPPARERAARARLAGGEGLLKDGRYEPSRVMLERVVVEPHATRARDLTRSPEMLFGLRLERALALADRRAALDEMTQVAAASVPAASRAQAWLRENARPVRLEIVKETCKSPGKSTCITGAKSLAETEPGTPEASEAAKIRAEYLAAEKPRVRDVLTSLEPQLEECAKLFRRDRVFQAWAPSKLERERWVPHMAGPPPPLVRRCEDDKVHDTCSEIDKRIKAARAAIDAIGYVNVATPARRRLQDACYAGEYKRQSAAEPTDDDLGPWPHGMRAED